MSKQARIIAIAVVSLVSVGYTIAAVVVSLLEGPPQTDVVTLVTFAAFYLPHFLNVRAALRNTRPRFFPFVLAVQVLATYLPELLLHNGWSAGTAPLLAGPLLLLIDLRWSVPVVVAMAGWQGYQVYVYSHDIGTTGYYMLTVLITGAMIYGLVRLVQVTTELEAARADLAEAAVLKERLRISRDLHDGLGRSLTAIALKGDLASRLLDRDPDAARTEVGELVQVAREAAQDVRQVARGYREMTLAGEINRAVALLESSGVTCQINLAAAALPKGSEEALAWAVREGVTNVLRHSTATLCTISTSVRDGSARLELVNDGAQASGAKGGGLSGLDERAAQAGGAVQASATESGGFRLAVEVPA